MQHTSGRNLITRQSQWIEQLHNTLILLVLTQLINYGDALEEGQNVVFDTGCDLKRKFN